MGFGAVLGQSRNAGSASTTSTGKRTARFSIGTSTNGWTANDCDYLCDGTDDQVEINAAIQALPSGGGEIVILDGTYNISATILINRINVSLIGNGRNTQLKRNWNSNNDEGIVTLNANYCSIKEIYFYGKRLTSYSHDIYVKYSNYCIINNNYTYSGESCILLTNSQYNTISSNNCSSSYDGIVLTNTSSFNTIDNNIVNKIETNTNSNFNIISNNKSMGATPAITILSANNTITGNNFSNGSTGIRLWSNATNNLVSGNTFCNNDYGISLSNYSSNNTIIGNICNNSNIKGIDCYLTSNNTIVGNSCFRGTGTSSDYTSTQYTIYINSDSNNNLFACNNLLGKNYTTNGISTNNTFVNNKY